MKISKLKYYYRCIRGWKKFLFIKFKASFYRYLCFVCEWMTPIHFVFDFLSLSEAVARERKFQEAQESWSKWEKEQLFIGADSDNPDGIYAQNGSDLVCMTNEEHKEWF